jgi:hypothetical protein
MHVINRDELLAQAKAHLLTQANVQRDYVLGELTSALWRGANAGLAAGCFATPASPSER